MEDLKISWRNILRNRRRSFFTIMAIAFAAAILIFMLSFQLGSYEDMIKASVTLDTGHIQVMKKGYNDNIKIRKYIDEDKMILKKIEELDSVQAVSFKCEGFSLVSSKNRTKGVLISGVKPEKEIEVSRLHKTIIKGEYLDPDSYGMAICGYLLAKRLKINIGDEITILGQARDGSVAAGIVVLKGIFKSGIDAFDKDILQVNDSYFDDIFFMDGKKHRMVIVLDSIKNFEKTESEILSVINPKITDVLSWEKLLPGLKQSMNMDLISGFVLYFILIIVVAFSILNTFLMSILERKKEYGVLLAIGTTPEKLMKLILSESMLLSITGLVAGITAGAALTFYYSCTGIPIGDASGILSEYGLSDKIYPKLSWVSFFTGPFLIFITTFLTAFFPALKIKKLKPVEAMNSV